MLHPRATAYQFLPDNWLSLTDFRQSDVVWVRWCGGDAWKITLGSWEPEQVWNFKSNEWVYSPSPSSRSEQFLAECRSSLQHCLSMGHVIANGLTDE